MINENRVKFENLSDSDLVVDTIYEGKRGASVNLAIEPLTKLIPGVSLMGGFRKRIRPKSNEIVGLVLLSTGREVDWPDHLDVYSGVYTYFGDNKEPGNSLLDTSRKGNKALEEIFRLAQGSEENTGFAHDTRFIGLLVPGTGLNEKEDLVAVWASKEGKRFQNYRAKFTVLDCGTISGSWVREIFNFGQFDLMDKRVPNSYKHWIKTGKRRALIADPKSAIRSVEEQQPRAGLEQEIIEQILLKTKEDPTEFEFVANEIWRIHYGLKIESGVTQKSSDGGRDALGHISIGPSSDPIKLSFVLEAKAYKRGNNVGVRELARLISRIKHREFGILVTTSAVSTQAYSEVRADGHPIVILSGHDIAQTLIQMGINSVQKVSKWIESLDKDRIK
jgi:hypothetical protein